MPQQRDGEERADEVANARYEADDRVEADPVRGARNPERGVQQLRKATERLKALLHPGIQHRHAKELATGSGSWRPSEHTEVTEKRFHTEHTEVTEKRFHTEQRRNGGRTEVNHCGAIVSENV